MNKQESQNLMIGSWVLAGGEPRQVSSLTTKKAGFKRGTSGHRDFFRFDQLQGIPLSEELLKECIKVVAPKKALCDFESMEPAGVGCATRFRETGRVYTLFISTLHELQSYLMSRYGCITEFDIEQYKYLQQPEIVIPNEIVAELMKHNPTMKNVPDAIVNGDTLVKRLDSVNKSRHLTYTKE